MHACWFAWHSGLFPPAVIRKPPAHTHPAIPKTVFNDSYNMFITEKK